MLLQEYSWTKEVLQSDEPVLVDFWADWCEPCHRMEPILESLARDFKVCKVNVDTNQELASHYRVSVLPTFLLFKGGRIVATFAGHTAEETLRSRLEELREGSAG
jgi:thioredoxin 1